MGQIGRYRVNKKAGREGVCFVLTGFCENKDYLIDSGMIGALSRRLHDELTGIQWGTKLNPFGWTCPID